MSVIRVVWGTAEGPTELAAYDAALAAADHVTDAAYGDGFLEAVDSLTHA